MPSTQRHLRRSRDDRRLVIEPARPEDCAALIDLFKQVLAEGNGFVLGPEEYDLLPEELEAQLRARQGSARHALFVARLERSLVGALRIEGHRPRRLAHGASLELWVAAPARGLGVGRALLEVGLGWAREGGQLARIDLSVFEDNAAARHLYGQAGFEVEGRRADFARETGGGPRPDLLMALRLRPA